MLFHFSSWARRRADNIAAATTTRSTTTRRLDIADPPPFSLERRRALHELLAVDDDLSPDLANRLIVLRGRDIKAHDIPGFERVLAPAAAGLGNGIPGFEHPLLNRTTVVLGVDLDQHVRIRPHVFRHCSSHRHGLPDVEG